MKKKEGLEGGEKMFYKREYEPSWKEALWIALTLVVGGFVFLVMI